MIIIRKATQINLILPSVKVFTKATRDLFLPFLLKQFGSILKSEMHSSFVWGNTFNLVDEFSSVSTSVTACRERRHPPAENLPLFPEMFASQSPPQPHLKEIFSVAAECSLSASSGRLQVIREDLLPKKRQIAKKICMLTTELQLLSLHFRRLRRVSLTSSWFAGKSHLFSEECVQMSS